MGFPVVTGAKRALLEGLAGDRVSAMDLWSVPHPSLAVAEFGAAAERRARTVALPVHQGLREHDLARVAESAARRLGRDRGSTS